MALLNTANILTRVDIGLVDVTPGLWLYPTTKTLAEVSVSGFLNPIVALLPQKPDNGDFLFVKASDGSESYVISLISGTYTLIPVGGSAGGFSYENAFWLAQNGDDDNTGTSIDSPLLTLDAVIAKIAALPDPTVRVVINVLDAGTYTATSSGYTFPTDSNVFINAPGATFATAGTIGLFRGTGGNLKVICGFLSAPSQRLITWGGSANMFINALSLSGNLNNDSAPGANITVDAAALIGSVTAGVDLSTILRIPTITGSITETSASAASSKMGIFATSVGGSISSTQGSIYGQVFEVSGSVAGIRQGIFDGVMYGVTTINTGVGVGLTLTSPTTGTYTLPPNDGSNGQSLETNGAGVVTWVSPA